MRCRAMKGNLSNMVSVMVAGVKAYRACAIDNSPFYSACEATAWIRETTSLSRPKPSAAEHNLL
jgi:hypothetical protein